MHDGLPRNNRSYHLVGRLGQINNLWLEGLGANEFIVTQNVKMVYRLASHLTPGM